MSRAHSHQTRGRTSAASSRSYAGLRKPRFLSLSLNTSGRMRGGVLGDGYSIAWRVLDAQYWGVPQRRARIFLVADFGGGGGPQILFNSEGLSGYSAEGFEAWKRAANDTEKGTGETGTGDGRVSGCFSADGYNGSVSEMASTLGVNCGMSTGRNAVVLNDQGGERMDITEYVTSTLRAEAHHPPVVLDEEVEAAGFCTEHSADSRGIGYEKEKSPTLRAGVVPGAIALEHHPNDNRIKIEEGNAIQTLSGRMGTGGGNVPLLMEQEAEPVTLKIRSGCAGGGKGELHQINKSATLGTHNDQTLFEPVAEAQTAFGISSYKSHAMLSDNPHAGIYEAKTSRTLDCSGGTPTQHQGGIAIVAIEGNGSRPSHKGDGYKETETMYTLNGTETHAVAVEESDNPSYGIDRAAFNQGENAMFGISVKEELEPTIVAKGPNAVGHPIYHTSKSGHFVRVSDEETMETLVATDYKDPPVVGKPEPYYIVRRLTPTECARLQGFPDWWTEDLGTDEPSENEISFWMQVFETHRRVVTGAKKPKTRKQIIKWLKDPQSDSAKYRLWGNGLALPIAYFVLSGIVYYAQSSGD